MLLISQRQDDIYIFIYFVSIEVYRMEIHVSFNINKNWVHLFLQSTVISFKLVYLFLLLFLHILLSCSVYSVTDIKSVISIVSICLSCWEVFSPILTPIQEYWYGRCLTRFQKWFFQTAFKYTCTSKRSTHFT